MRRRRCERPINTSYPRTPTSTHPPHPHPTPLNPLLQVTVENAQKALEENYGGEVDGVDQQGQQQSQGGVNPGVMSWRYTRFSNAYMLVGGIVVDMMAIGLAGSK